MPFSNTSIKEERDQAMPIIISSPGPRSKFQPTFAPVGGEEPPPGEEYPEGGMPMKMMLVLLIAPDENRRSPHYPIKSARVRAGKKIMALLPRSQMGSTYLPIRYTA